MKEKANVSYLWPEKTLLISDKNLGDRSYNLMRNSCHDLTWICWDRSVPDSKKQLLETIAAESWKLCISFYSDLIIPGTLLEKIELAVNIHPALPGVRGVGYDTLPLIEKHQCHGTTLHRIIEEIDLGEIFHVIEEPLNHRVTYSQLRKANQELCLKQLELLNNWMLDCHSVVSLELWLKSLGIKNTHQWSDTYISRSDLNSRLHSLRQCKPDHPVFK